MIIFDKAQIQVSQNKIVANLLNNSFIHYYRQLAYMEFPNLKYGLSLPRYGSHITIARNPLEVFDLSKAKKYQGLKIEYSFDPTQIYLGGFVKGFVGFYVRVESSQLTKIRKEILLEEPKSSLHLSLFSTKNNSKQ